MTAIKPICNDPELNRLATIIRAGIMGRIPDLSCAIGGCGIPDADMEEFQENLTDMLVDVLAPRDREIMEELNSDYCSEFLTKRELL